MSAENIILSVAAMRESDARTIAEGIPGRELMLRAGKAVFERIDWKAPAAILCGSGNNAGDGYVLAKLLHDAGTACEVIMLSDRCSEDGAYYLSLCQEAGVKVTPWTPGRTLEGFGTVVDCLFGTGFRGTAEGAAAEAIRRINESGAYVVSVDINSGLNGDSGLAETCVRSDLTVSVGSFQPGHFLNMAKDVMKEKVNCDIGIRPVDEHISLVTEADIAPFFRPRANNAHKGTYGYTALIGGSRKYSGAVRLAAMANSAMRTGAGVVKLAVPDLLWPAVAPAVLESTVFPLMDDGDGIAFDEGQFAELTGNVRTAAFGMGVGTGEGAAQALRWLLEHFGGTLIVDADGLTLLSRLDRERIHGAACRLILTPHVKEFSRLTGMETGEILHAPIASAEAYAKETGAVILLKGPSTVVTDGVRTRVVDAGCAGMATAGSGDVLSGILSAAAAFIPDRPDAAAAAAWINGKAGEKAQERYGSVAMTAGDTANCVRDIVSALEKAN
ncbi:MAG: NAD(P)H-hydrate dehydratase [Clostridia bacterium]|nr:NAD(P)H-hydrate dehydratase [Clostridia bacterium]